MKTLNALPDRLTSVSHFEAEEKALEPSPSRRAADCAPSRASSFGLSSRIVLVLAWCLAEATSYAQSTATNVVAGAIAAPGERDAFTFNVPAGQRYYFDALSNASELQWSLSGPEGAVVVNRSFRSSDSQSIGDPTVWLQPGDYTLTVQSANGTTNGYTFRFINLADAALLTPGTVVSNALSPANKTDLYQFTAAAGDRYVFHQVSRVGLPNTYWRLLDPYGNQVFSQGFTDAGTAQSPVTLLAAGTYTLMVEGYIGDTGAGSYQFQLVSQGSVPPPPLTGAPMQVGEVIAGSLSANTTNAYIFTLGTAERVIFDTLTNSPNLNWSLCGPSGLIVNQRGLNSSDGLYNYGPFDLPAGDYQLLIRGNANNPYRFRLLDLATATPITVGTPLTNALSPANATAMHRFNATAGARFYFRNLSLGGLPNAYWRLIDPYGVVLFAYYAGNSQGPLTLNISGTYTLLVEGYWGDPDSGTYTFNVTPVIDGQQALGLGAVTSGAISSPGQKQRYTFALGAAARLYFDSLTNTSSLRWSLDGPTGNVVNNRAFNGSDAQSIGNPVLALPAGNYTLTVFPNGDSVGAYQFRLFDLATANPLTPGTPVSGTLNPANSTVAYQFSLAAPGKVFYDFQSSSGLPNTFIELLDAHGNVPLRTYLGNDTGPLSLAAGTYTLLIEGYVGDPGSGSYSFNMVSVTDGQQALTLGAVTSGAISSPGQNQRYTFALGTAARLYFDSLTNTSSLRWSLDGPTGNVVNNRAFNYSDAQSIGNPVLALPAGNYTLTVFPYGDSVGSYQFRLFDLATASPLTLGTTVSGTLNPANSTVAYQFSLAAPGKVFYDYQSSSGLPNAFIELQDAYGNVPLRTYLGNDTGPLSLAAGTYTLLIEGYVGDTGGGSYSFNLVPVTDGQQALILGAVTSGAISSPGQKQRYTFALGAAARLYFDSLTNTSSLRWSLDGPTGNVVNNRAFNYSDAQSIGNPVLALPAGNYALTVFPDGDSVGGFQFRLLDFAAATPVTPGTAVSVNNFQANSTALYRFEANAGDQFYFPRLAFSGMPNAYWRLVDPYNNFVFARYFDSVTTNRLVATGTYTLLVEGYIGDNGLGSYGFSVEPAGNVPPNPFTGAPLAIGSLATGNLNTNSASVSYIFTLGANARLYFDALTNANFTWSLRGPPGLVVDNRNFLSSDSADINNPLLTLPAGDYQLTVSGQAGPYQFRLLDLANATAYTPGTLISDALSPADSTVFYQFTGTAGQQLYFDGHPAAGFTYQPYCRLYGPAGNVIFTSYVQNEVDTFSLPQSGVYTLTVEGRIYDTHVSGNYSFNLLPVTYSTNALPLGQTIASTLATPGQRQYYTLTLAAGARLYFDALTNADFVWRLDAPWGQVVDWRSFNNSDSADVNEPSVALGAGVYTLTVAGNYFSATGEYRFRLLDMANAAAFAPGTEVSNILSPANGTVLYQFTGTAGQQLYFDGLPTSGFSYPPYCRLYGPAGKALTATYVNSDLDTFALPQSGTYTLTVEGRIYDSHESGTYGFNLVPVTYPTNTLTVGERVIGTITTPGQRQFFTFTLPMASTLYFDALTNADFVWRLDGPWGQVVDWRSFSSSDSADATDPSLTLPAGAYTLTVAGSYFRVTGDYQFRLLNFADAAACTPGVPVSGALSPAKSTALYQFTATAGQRFYYDGQPVTGFTYTPYSRLYGPAGNIILNTYVGTDVDTFSLPQSGIYTFTVEGRVFDQSASGSYSFNLVPNPPQPPQPLFPESVLPDLVVTSVSILPSSGLQSGGLVTVQWTEQNAGSGATSGSFTDRVVIRNALNQVLADSLLPYNESDPGNGPLVPGSSRERQVTVRLPDGTNSVGTLRATVSVDAQNSLAESNEANNSASMTFPVTIAPYPDLQVNSLSTQPPTGWLPGSTVVIQWQLTNSGAASAITNWTDTVVVRNTNAATVIFNGSTNYDLADPNNGPLAPGKTRTRALSFTMPNNANAFGTFAITVSADSANQVFEYNLDGTAENNNSATLNVISAPDLVPTGLAVSPAGPLRSGANITVSWMDQNAGTVETSGGFSDRVTVVNLDTSEVLLNSTVYYDPGAPGTGAIPPGGTRARSTRLQLPDGPRSVGTLQITVALDTYNQVPDSNGSGTGEANNAANVTALSTIGDYPNLQVANLTVQPAVLYSGTNLTLRWQDTNSGTAAALSSWQDRVTIINTNLGLTLLDTTLYYDVSSLGVLTNGMARDRFMTFTLPSGSNGAGGLLFRVTADCYNNVFEYNAAGTGESDNTTSLVAFSSLAPLPDLMITSLSSTNRAFTSQIIKAQFRLANKGLVMANGDTVQRVFLSSSPTPGSGTLAAQATYSGLLGVGQSVDQTVSVLMPSTPGTYWLIAQADANNSLPELSEENNYLVSPTPIDVQPAYAATVTAGLRAALANTPVPMHGKATLGDSTQPAAFVPVTIHIQVRGTDRTFEVVTAADGTFTNVFRPLPGEAGVYQLSAALPSQPAPPAQDTFVLIGMGISPMPMVNLTEGTGVTNSTRVENLSDVPLTGLTVTILTNQPNLAVTANLNTNDLAGFASANLSLAIRALDAAIYQSPVVLRITSAEGAVADLTFMVRVEALRPRLVVAPTSLQGAMQRGAQTSVAFSVANQGGVPTGPLQIVLPSEPWLSLASVSQLPPLAPGSNTTVTLLLTPAADLPLGEYTGTLVLQSTNAAASVPFAFRAVSAARGNMLVTAEDEYTYFAAGSPRVTDAQVILRDALTGTPVVTNITGLDGSVLLTNLTEAYYIVDVNATGHSPFRETALLPAGATTNIVAFLQRQTITYDFTVTPTTIADRYIFSIASTFETQVPVPVVTIEPASLDLAQYPGAEVQVLYTIANHGLIDAEQVTLDFPDTDYLHFTALVTNLGKLPANTSFTVPVLIKRTSPTGVSALSTETSRTPKDYTTGQCSVTARMLWDYLCGPNVVNKKTAMYVFDSTGCDLVDLYFKVYDLVPNDSSGSGSSTNAPMTTQDFVDYLNQFKPIKGFKAPPGYHFQCKTTPPPAALAHEELRSPMDSNSSTSVCAKVEIRLDQEGVVARDAFKATLQINNDLTNTLRDLRAELQVTDLNGVPVSTNFGISSPDLSGLTALDGTGVLPGNTLGLAHWTIVPTLEAAPSSGVTIYLVGGSLNYTQDGTTVSVPLAPAPIQVYPQPELVVRYFHNRDVFADDPFTPQIEPSIPFSLAVQVINVGHGAAQSLNLSSAKPQIVENVKGLLVNFTILGTELENRQLTPSLSVDFGRIDPGTNAIARWLFSSSVQGSFTNFSASFSEVDQLGNPRLSLIRSVEIHELTHIVNAGGLAGDSRSDFLVNDLPDPEFLPDTLYLSDGSIAPVTAVTDAGISGTLADTNLSVRVTTPPVTGWSYLRFGDPNPGAYQLTHVRRGDGSEVSMGTNAWTTDRSFQGGDKMPIHTNLVHLLDFNSAGTYTLVYTPVVTNAVDAVPPTSAVASLPATSPPQFTVQWSGSDNVGGSGIAFYDIFVSENNGSFAPWITNTTLSAALYGGSPNSTYAFYSQATDLSGNREAPHPVPDAQTSTTKPANSAPVIAAIPTQTVVEGSLFNFTPSGTDADLPAQTLTWSLLPGAPPGALIASSTGRILWQTSLGAGGTTNRLTLVVTDNGSPSLSATQAFIVVVTPVNHRPFLVPPPALVTGNDQALISLQLSATDPDFPEQSLTWQVGPGAPAGLLLNPSTGLLTWTPNSAQAPSTNVVTVVVRDNGSPSLSDTNTFVILVTKANHAPVLAPIADQSAFVLQPLFVTNSAQDTDLPSQTLTFSLDPGAPVGARIHTATGVFIWAPTRAQAPSTNLITVRVTDNGFPPLSATRSFTVVVHGYVEVMLGTSLVRAGEPGEVSVDVNATASVTNVSFTLDVPAQVLTNFTLAPPLPPVAVSTLQQIGPAQYRISFCAASGQVFSGPLTLSKLGFDTVAGTPSTFLPLRVSALSANQPDGIPMERALAQDGRVVFINQAPLLEAFLNGPQFLLVLYAPPGPSYSLESTHSLTPPITWSPLWSGAIGNNLVQVVPVASTNRSSFFRGKTP